MQKRDKQSDLIWFDYETRLRTLVEELLEPTLRRSREERELFEMLNRKNEQINKRLDDIEFMFQRTQKRQTAFEDIFKRIHDLDVSRKAEDKSLSDRIDLIKKNMEELNTDMFVLKGSMDELERKGQKLSDEFVTTTDHLAEYKTGVNKSVFDLDQSWKTQVEEQQSSRRDLLAKIQQTNDKVAEVVESIKTHSLNIEAAQKSIDQLGSKSAGLDKKIEKNNEDLQGFTKQASFLSTFKSRLDSLERQLCIDEKYIELYLPVFMQVQIAETVHESLHPNDRKRHAVYEQKMLQTLIDNLQTVEQPNLGKKIEKMKEVVDPAVQKYTGVTVKEKKGGVTRSADLSVSAVKGEEGESEVDTRLLADLNQRITNVHNENMENIKATREEFLRKFLMISKEQVEVSENVSSSMRNLPEEIARILEERENKVKEKQATEAEERMRTQTSEVKGNERPQTANIPGEKTMAFFRSLSEVFSTSVDVINGVLATLLREERDREMEEQDRPLAYSQMLKDVANSRRAPPPRPDKFKKSTTEVLHSQGTREFPGTESPVNPKEIDMRQINPETISKLELLMMMFENFKPCLSFAMKFRIASDFLQFFEIEASRYESMVKMKKDGSQTIFPVKMSSEERGKERSITPQMKSRVSRTNSMSNKSSLGDIPPGTSFERKAGGVSSISKV